MNVFSLLLWSQDLLPYGKPVLSLAIHQQRYTLCLPQKISPQKNSFSFPLLPTLSRLAFIIEERVLVWDAKHSKIFLDSEYIVNPTNMYFSPDGHFICGTNSPEFYLWKESSSGYLPCQKLISSAKRATPVVSPNGKLIISFGGSMLQLWHTINSPPPSISTQAS